MARFSRRWPQPSNASQAWMPHSQRPATTTTNAPALSGISPRATTAILAFAAFWNFALLILAITIVVVSSSPTFEWPYDVWYNRNTSLDRAKLVFLWCTIPFILFVVSVFDLVRRNSLTARRAAFSAGAGGTLYLLAFLLWGDCGYLSYFRQGLHPICYHLPNWEYFHEGNPIALIFVMPWFALGATLTYGVLAILALLTLRRQRQSASANRKSLQAVELGRKPSKDYSEISASVYSELEPSSIGEETLPSRPRSTVPSRQLSMANHTTRPPTYYSSGDDSLLTVEGKGEGEKGRGSVGYA